MNRQIQQKSRVIPALRIPSENLNFHCDEQDCSVPLNKTSFQLVLIRPINLLLARRMIPFFCVAKTTFNTLAEFFVFSLSSDVSQHQKLNQQRCLVSQRVDALGRWNKIIKIIRLTKNVAVTNGFFSSFF